MLIYPEKNKNTSKNKKYTFLFYFGPNKN